MRSHLPHFLLRKDCSSVRANDEASFKLMADCANLAPPGVCRPSKPGSRRCMQAGWGAHDLPCKNGWCSMTCSDSHRQVHWHQQ
jgi:hypothetical protein